MRADSVVGPGQGRVLESLRAHEGPTTIAELALATGLGESTLRAHLTALADSGLATRLPVRSGRRGRPQWAYVAREPENAGLVRALASALEAARPPSAAFLPEAVVAGREWGSRVADDLAPLIDSATSDAERLDMALTHAGFEHEADVDAVRITACPLIGLARDHTSVVCAAHLGMLQGVLDREEGVDLVPFVAGGCLISVR
ncbi:MAG: ArsR family transcriptional regulator [Nocardioides sp.]|nr:ArsR family transcriptional regulator [Nocardioides sp.]